jgi:hypothetical protein
MRTPAICLLVAAAFHAVTAALAWAGNPPLLVVAAGAALNAFHVGAP